MNASTTSGAVLRLASYIGRRIGLALIAILGVATVAFIVTRIMASPINMLAGNNATPELIATLERQHGLDKSIPEQYVTFIVNLAQGDLGVSMRTLQPVTEEIWLRLPATLELAVVSLLLALLIGCPLGAFAALKHGTWLDRLTIHGSSFFIAIPAFWLGLLLILLFYYILGIAPVPLGQIDPKIAKPEDITGFLLVDSLLTGNMKAFGSAVEHMMLPALTVALTTFPSLFQLTRDTLHRVLRSDYIRTARSLGISRRTIYGRYAMRNVLVPVLTMAAMTLGWLIGSTVLVETVFAWPGIGLYAVDSIRSFDYAPVVGLVITTATIYVVLYALVDIASHIIDPRTRA